MNYKRCNKKIIVRIDKGEEIIEKLKQICTKLEIKAGTITGIGAIDKATIGLFDLKKKKYHSKNLIGDHEIAPLCGNITTMSGEVYLHLHVNLCNAEHKSFGGHLNSAIVSVTFEGIIDIIDDEINRKLDKKTGLNFIEI